LNVVFELKADVIGTCCRGCIQKWHGIQKGRELNEKEMEFIVALIMGWIEQQFDDEKVCGWNWIVIDIPRSRCNKGLGTATGFKKKQVVVKIICQDEDISA